MAEQRTRLSPAARRAQIVAIGVEQLVDHPLEHITVERIASIAGVSRGLVFHYFGSLPGLRHAIVVTARDALVHASEVDERLEPYARLRTTLTNLVAFVAKHPRTFHALVRGAASADPAVRSAVDEARAVLAERVLAGFAELGIPSSRELDIVVRAWIAFAEEAIVEATDPAQSMPNARLVELLERSVLAVVGAMDEPVAPSA